MSLPPGRRRGDSFRGGCGRGNLIVNGPWSLPATLLVETKRVQREILAVEHVVQERRTKENAGHVLLGPGPICVLRITQEAGAA